MSDVESDENLWTYLDSDNIYKGPFTSSQMDGMNQNGDFQRIGVTKVKCRGSQVLLNKKDYGKLDFFKNQKIEDQSDSDSEHHNQNQNNKYQSDPNKQSKQTIQEQNREESDQIYSDSDVSVVNKEMGDFSNAIIQTGMDIVQLDLVLSLEIIDVQKQDNWSQYEIVNTDILKDLKNGIQYERTLSHAETQTGLSALENSLAQTRSCFQKLVIPPSVEKCINTEFSLRRGNQDEEYIENKFTTYRDVQAVEVGDYAGARVPIVKKEQHGQKESIFAHGADELQKFLNQDLDPVAYREQQFRKLQDMYADPYYDDYYDENFENNICPPEEDNDQYRQIQEPSEHYQNNYQNYDYQDRNLNQSNNQHSNYNQQSNYNQSNNQQTTIQQQNQVINLPPLNFVPPKIPNIPTLPETNKQFFANGEVYDNNDFKVLENNQDTRTGTEKQTLKEVQNAMPQFKELILKAINEHFLSQGMPDQTNQPLKESLVNYRKHYAIRRIHLNFKKIAAQLGLTEKQVSQMFRTLQDQELDDWPKEKIQAVTNKATEFWEKYAQHPVDRKALIRKWIDDEFKLSSEYQYSPKKITNKINYILKKLCDQ
ncbi:GYF-like_domain superfamily [Hexamita inflata]|uniref:GYF-like domain superfamily n=1 Tax=Hexamita inflata TaxID=28002 RepID=A0AA86TIH4_9EUKA|nr:GYF-like domain superfamily [Hexamita inflata]